MASQHAPSSRVAPCAKKENSDLKKYLAEQPSRHVCARTWLPGVYKFNKRELLYRENAYDRYKYVADEYEDEPDEIVHSEFTEYLETIPHDESHFLNWIRKSKKNFEGDIVATRRAIMHPQLNKELLALRASYVPQTALPDVAETEFSCDEGALFKAEEITWAIKYKKTHGHEKLEVGFMNVEPVEGTGMVFGPRRFYVRRINRAHKPHSRFTKDFTKYVDECKKTNRHLDAFPPKQEGLLVLYDHRKDKYSSVVVVQNNAEENHILVYETETGRIVSVSRRTIDERLRAVPEDFDGWVVPESIPVELAEDVSSDEWQQFYNNLIENGKVYVTAVDGYKIKVTHFEEVRRQAEPDKIYCRNIYCLGKCAIPSQWRHPPVPQALVHQPSVDSGRPRAPTDAAIAENDDEWWEGQ